MNKNTSPHSRSSSGPRSQARGRTSPSSAAQPAARVASRAGAQARSRTAPKATGTKARLIRMLLTVGVPNLAVIGTIVVIALASVLLSSAPLAWLPSIIGEAWMVLNLVPVHAGGNTISVLPFLPAIGLVWLLAGRIHRAVKHKVSVNDLLLLLACAVGVPVLITLVAWFMLWDAGKVYDLAAPNLAVAVLRVAVIHLVALALGMGPRLWTALLKRYGLPVTVVASARVAFRFIGALLMAGLALLLVVGLFGWQRQGEILNSYPNLPAAGAAALYGLSLLYLPNAALVAGANLLGAEFHMGQASVSLFSIHLVPLPPLPLVGVIPGSAPAWALVLLVLAGAAAAWAWRGKNPSPRTAVEASVLAGLSVALLAAFTTGEVGVYGATGIMVAMAGALAVVWVLVIGLAAWGISLWQNSRAKAPSAAPAAAPAADAASPSADEAPAREADAAEMESGAEAPSRADSADSADAAEEVGSGADTAADADVAADAAVVEPDDADDAEDAAQSEPDAAPESIDAEEADATARAGGDAEQAEQPAASTGAEAAEGSADEGLDEAADPADGVARGGSQKD
ncbi:cell division protein PerM [Corynebacterium sp. 32222D000AT]